MQKSNETIVWDVKLLGVRDEIVLVSGDSHGYVKFWDAEFGTLLKQFSMHYADVLCLEVHAYSTNVNAVPVAHYSVYATGVDGQISSYSYVEENKNGEWVVSKKTRWMNRGVNALIISSLPTNKSGRLKNRPFIIAGGVNTILYLCDIDNFGVRRNRKNFVQEIYPYPQRSIVSVAWGTRNHSDQHGIPFLVKQKRSLQLWKTGSSTDGHEIKDCKVTDSGSVLLPVDHTFVHRLEFSWKNLGWSISCLSISPDGKWIVCSTIKQLKLYSVATSRKKLEIKKVDIQNISASYTVCFSPNSKMLIAATLESIIHIFCLTTKTIITSFHNHTAKDNKFETKTIDQGKGIIFELSPSRDGKWLASVDHLHRIHVFQMENEKKHVCQLPKDNNAPTAVAFHPTLPILIVALRNHAFYGFDVEQKKKCKWCHENKMFFIPPRIKSKPSIWNETISSISFDSAGNSNCLLFALQSYVVFVNFSKEFNTKYENPTMKQIPSKNGLLHAGFVPKHTRKVIMVEVEWLKVVEKMLEPIYRKHYGYN